MATNTGISGTADPSLVQSGQNSGAQGQTGTGSYGVNYQGLGPTGGDPFSYTNDSLLTPWTQQFHAPESSGGYASVNMDPFAYKDFGYEWSPYKEYTGQQDYTARPDLAYGSYDQASQFGYGQGVPQWNPGQASQMPGQFNYQQGGNSYLSQGPVGGFQPPPDWASGAAGDPRQMGQQPPPTGTQGDRNAYMMGQNGGQGYQAGMPINGTIGGAGQPPPMDQQQFMQKQMAGGASEADAQQNFQEYNRQQQMQQDPAQMAALRQQQQQFSGAQERAGAFGALNNATGGVGQAMGGMFGGGGGNAIGSMMAQARASQQAQQNSQGAPGQNVQGMGQPNQFQGVPAFQAPTITDDPSFKFRTQEGLNALQNTALGKGVRGGDVQQALQNYGQQAGSQEYAAAWQRAMGQQQNAYEQASNTYGQNAQTQLQYNQNNFNQAATAQGLNLQRSAQAQQNDIGAYQAQLAGQGQGYQQAANTFGMNEANRGAAYDRNWQTQSGMWDRNTQQAMQTNQMNNQSRLSAYDSNVQNALGGGKLGYDIAGGTYDRNRQNAMDQWNSQYQIASQNASAANSAKNNEYGRAMQEYQMAYGIFNQNQENQYNRLSGMAGMGMQANAQAGNAGSNYSNAYGQNVQGGANAYGAAQMAGANAWGQALGAAGSGAAQVLGMTQYNPYGGSRAAAGQQAAAPAFGSGTPYGMPNYRPNVSVGSGISGMQLPFYQAPSYG